MAKKKLTPEQGGTIGRMENENRYIDLAKHCIGLDRKKPYIRNGKKFYRPYRNFFATGRNYEDWETINLLADTRRIGLGRRTAGNTHL